MEDLCRLTLVPANSATCELYVFCHVPSVSLTAKYTVYRWASLRFLLAPSKVAFFGVQYHEDISCTLLLH